MLQSSTPIAQPLRGAQRAVARRALGRTLLADGAPLRFVVRGSSMWPALKRGDVVEVEAASVASLRRGDVAVVRQGAVLLVHRVIEVLTPAEGPRGLRLRGDTRRSVEGPIGEGELLGRIRQRKRRGRVRRLDRGLSRAWGQAMLQVGGLWAWCFDRYRAWRRTRARRLRFITAALVLAASLVSGAVTRGATFTSPQEIVLPRHAGPLSDIEVLAVLNRLKDTVVDPLRRAAARLAHRRFHMTAERLDVLSRAGRPTRPRQFHLLQSAGAVLLVGSEIPPTPHTIPGPAFAVLGGRFDGYVHVTLLRPELGRSQPNEIAVTFAPDTLRGDSERNARQNWARLPGEIRFDEYLAPRVPHQRQNGRKGHKGLDGGDRVVRSYSLYRHVVEH